MRLSVFKIYYFLLNRLLRRCSRFSRVLFRRCLPLLDADKRSLILCSRKLEINRLFLPRRQAHESLFELRQAPHSICPIYTRQTVLPPSHMADNIPKGSLNSHCPRYHEIKLLPVILLACEILGSSVNRRDFRKAKLSDHLIQEFHSLIQ